MTAPLGPGDWIQCVSGEPHRHPDAGAARLTVGAIYQVSRVFAAGNYPELGARYAEDCVQLVGDLLTEPLAWRLRRFKPIHPGGALTRLLMEPVSDRIEPGVSRKSRQDQPAHDEPVSSLREVA